MGTPHLTLYHGSGTRLVTFSQLDTFLLPSCSHNNFSMPPENRVQKSDCLVCGRVEEPPHDCAIHVLLESMVFQERMLHGEPTQAKLEEILKNGKEYLSLAMLMTDENSVRWQTMYNYVKSGFPQHQGNSSRNVR
ncbi:uncharacterized protein TNCV_4721891 [Trichonephila clavipes]|uniref:Uncharacterized protein n=1 Tax=Trichonephila clavipes TaxID=2585209 RepID=A0A8X6W751_TRICX|nr:uncharacterized protein TNCV_4721891 [Trichonephila clavipes]